MVVFHTFVADVNYLLISKQQPSGLVRMTILRTLNR